MDKLIALYEKYLGYTPLNTQKIPLSGSNRSYYRFTDKEGKTIIGVKGVSKEENHAFIYLAKHFYTKQIPVPKVLAVSDDELYYLQSDLGQLSLYDALKGGREANGKYNLKEIELLKKTIRALPNIQINGAHGLDFSNCYPQPEFDKESVLFDLNYFKYCFLKSTGLDFHELKLEANFQMLAKDLTAEPMQAFLYRDFQARNVMLDHYGNPFFIDFQGGRKGPYYYDLASFLWQASAKYPFKLRRQLIAEYYESLKQYTEVPSVRHFVSRLSLFILFRTLQVLGAYGFRGYFEHKQYFINSIPYAIQNLRDMVNTEGLHFPYPHLMDILKRLINLPQFSPKDETSTKDKDLLSLLHIDESGNTSDNIQQDKDKSKLVVKVFSFSFKKGIPNDDSGNGGGYVFDCRSTHNPGRYPLYKDLNGLTEPVIRFLEDDGEILNFLKPVYALADHHVKRYIERNFTHLMFCFGCTGGQHRSVYSAQHLAEHIHNKFNIEVHIIHREQGIKQILLPK